MAEFAYSLDGGLVVKDFEIDSSYTAPKRGDFVVLNASGKIVKTVALTGTAITGVLEGQEFTGLVAQGQPYAATNTYPLADAAKRSIVKVRIGKEAVYRVPVGNATAANIGAVVGFTSAGAVDTAATAKPLKVLDVQGAYAFVTVA